jgi:hypothetical protein
LINSLWLAFRDPSYKESVNGLANFLAMSYRPGHTTFAAGTARRGGRSMTRKTLKTVLLVLLAVFSLSAIGEAAPRKAVRHRPRHTRRIAAAATTAKKKTVRVTRRAATRSKQAAARAATRTKRAAARAATTTKRVVKRKTTTKPR